MVSYHPTENELIEYSAGNCDWAVAIAISAHLHFCTECREKLLTLNKIGGNFLDESKGIETAKSSFSDTLSLIKAKKSASSPDRTITKKVNYGIDIPPVLTKLIPPPDTLNWSRVSPSLKESKLKTGQEKFEVSLHKICKGGKVVEHDHRGKEIVLVLDGSFSDESGSYKPGDYITREPGQIHRPTATEDKDCLCLSIVAAPVKVTGILGKVVNPFIRFNPQ